MSRLSPPISLLLLLLLVGRLGACEPQELAQPNELDELPGSELALAAQEDDVVTNYVLGRPYAEKYNRRCRRSTRLEPAPGAEPSLVLLRRGEPERDARLFVNATDAELLAAGFDPTKPTTVFVHGMHQSYSQTPYLQLTRKLLQRLDNVELANFLVLDWDKLALGAYAEVAARTGAVANYLAFFLERLFRLGADPKRVHLIGHSVGAHVAGFAGRRAKPEVGRITALDPAGPCFGRQSALFKGVNGPDDRVSPTDAHQVDVYHYDELIGSRDAHGDVDVYVNGGKEQPGCEKGAEQLYGALLTAVLNRRQSISASHTRASLVPTVQLEPDKCQQVAYECESFASFLTGACADCGPANESCFVLGFPFQYERLAGPELPLRNFKEQGRSYHLVMNNNRRFCSNHYQVLVAFDATEAMLSAAASNRWRLHLELSYERADGRRETTELRFAHQLSPGVFSHLLTTDVGPVRFTGARLRASQRYGSHVPLKGEERNRELEEFLKDAFKVNSISVKYMSNIEPEVRARYSSRLCAGETRGLIQSLRFTLCDQ